MFWIAVSNTRSLVMSVVSKMASQIDSDGIRNAGDVTDGRDAPPNLTTIRTVVITCSPI